MDFLLKHITLSYKPKKALDIGAGTELRQSMQMAAEGIFVDAVEPKPITVPVSNPISLFSSCIEDFSFIEDTYDLVLARMVFHFLKPETNLSNLINNKIYSSLKQGGIFLIVAPESFVLPDHVYGNLGSLKFPGAYKNGVQHNLVAYLLVKK